MPIYEYQCESCQTQFELLVRNSEQRPECPDCGSGKVERLFSTFAAHMAGGAGCQEKRCPAAEGGCPGQRRCPVN